MYKGNTQTGKYKTTMCKHYMGINGCSYGEKCQFAHGEEDLRASTQGNNYSMKTGMGGMGGMMGMGMNSNPNFSQKKDNNFQNKAKTNPANFKIVKCKNFDRDGQCKYGNTCTFAHGDNELRTKVDNAMMFPNQMPNEQDPYSMMMNPNFMMYMNSMGSMGYPGNMPQMQMYGGMDQGGNLNLNPNDNTTSNSAYPEMGNMGFYQMYPNQGGNITEN